MLFPTSKSIQCQQVMYREEQSGFVRVTDNDDTHHILATGDFTSSGRIFPGFDSDGFIDVDVLF